MNEDEAFLRAIVDNPGDDTPRLVYADWLDDRDDPRGPYLRAEREAVETGDIARLRELAVGLDPVWVARVSMPPVGVCTEHVEIEGRGPVVSRADVAAAEVRLGVSFPPDYVAFLLNYNGGWIGASPRLETPEGEIVRIHDAGWRFDPIGPVKRFRVRSDDLLTAESAGNLPPLLEPVESWLARYVVIGHISDQIDGMFLGAAGGDRGHVRFLDTSVEIEVSVRNAQGSAPSATSLSEFLASLRDPGWWVLPPPGELSAGEPASNDIPF